MLKTLKTIISTVPNISRINLSMRCFYELLTELPTSKEPSGAVIVDKIKVKMDLFMTETHIDIVLTDLPNE